MPAINHLILSCYVAKSNQMAKTTIYVVVSKNGLFKIGESANVQTRINQLVSSSPCQIEPFFWFAGTLGLEKGLHDIFDAKRVRGEWFALDKSDLQKLVSIAEHNLAPAVKEHIIKLLDELESWGFFELGKTELHQGPQLATLYRCSVVMKR